LLNKYCKPEITKNKTAYIKIAMVNKYMFEDFLISLSKRNIESITISF